MNLIYIIFAVILVVSAILGRYIHSHKFKYATEGSASLLLGTGITGLVSLVYYASTHEALTPSSLRLPDSVFFQVLLPGIIFYAGFSVKKRMFFRNFATIFTFGFFGTLISASAISFAASAVLKSLDIAPGLVLQSALALGAICACSDTVAILQIMDKQASPMLHSLVFGEGIVNDAVAIVLLSAVQNLMARHHHLSLTAIAELLLSFMSLFVSSLLLGVGVGLLSALMIRHIFAKHRDADREVMLLALLGYLSYLIADALDLSAILSVFICGVTMSHYSWHSMCPAAQALALHTFRLISGVMEMILYAYSGINIWTSALWRASDSRVHLSHALTLASVLLVTMVVARISFTYPISAIASWTMTRGYNKKTQQQQQQQQQQHDHHQAYHHQGRRISMLDATVIMWGGLSRGAVTLALAYHEFNTPTHANQVMVLAVVLVVLVSTVVLGTITGPLMEFIMKTHKEQQRKQHQQQRRWQQQQQDELQDPLLPPNHEHQQEDRFPRTAAGGMNGHAHDLEIGNADAAMHIPAAAAAAGNAHQARSYERHRSSLDAGLVCIEEDSATNCDDKQQQQHQLNARPIAIRGTNASRLADAAAAAVAAAVAAAEAGDQDDWHWGRRGRVLSRLPSMDETTETTREQEQEHLRRTAAAAAAAAAATANAFQQQRQRQQQQLPNALTFPVDPTFIHQELQRLQLSSYDGISSTTANLPYIHTPSDAEGGGGTGATSTALTRTASTGSLENSTSHHHHHQQQQQQQPPMGGTSGDTGTRSPAVHVLSDGAVQQQQQRRDREPQWYIQQQVRLLEELSQLQQEYQQQCQQQQQQQQGSGSAATAAGSSSWHGFHRLWRQFDVRYLQPVFGGREVAKRTSTPMEFENYI